MATTWTPLPVAEPNDPHTQDALTRSELRDATLRGARWVTLGRLGVELAAFAGSIVVARHVSPAQFGHAAAAAFVYALAMGLPASSFGSPLVQAKALRPATTQAVLALSCVAGLLGALAGSLAAGGPAAAEAPERVVNIYNWSDYIDPKVLEDFTRQTGIKVVYDTYDNNEILETKLLAGRSGYDDVPVS